MSSNPLDGTDQEEEDTDEQTTTDVKTTSISTTYKTRGEIADTSATGVLGRATASSSTTRGVLGESSSPDGQGVTGFAITDSFSTADFTGSPVGIYGATDRSGADSDVADSAGAFGWVKATSGSGAGVVGRTDSPDGEAVRGLDNTGNGLGVRSVGDSKTEGNHEVTGSMSVGKSSFSVWLDTNQSIPGGRTRTRVEFDTVETDDFGGWDSNNYQYVIPEPGDYAIDCTVRFAFLGGDVRQDLWVALNGRDYIRASESVWRTTLTGSRTAVGLSAGDTISVDVAQKDSQSRSLSGSKPDTFLTIVKVG